MDEPSSITSSNGSRRLAHDLLQSIMVLRAIVSSVRAEPTTPAATSERLALVEGEAESLAEICRQHLDGDNASVTVPLAAVVRAAVARAQAVDPRSIELEIALGDDARVLGGATEWDRALLNLLDNAGRAAGSTGTVRVRAVAERGTYRISVADSGPGFGEVADGRASLGLLSATRVADRHDGHLRIGRSDLGGAEVSIVVPVPDPT